MQMNYRAKKIEEENNRIIQEELMNLRYNDIQKWRQETDIINSEIINQNQIQRDIEKNRKKGRKSQDANENEKNEKSNEKSNEKMESV